MKEPPASVLVVARTLILTMAWPAAAAVSLAFSVGGRAVTASGLLLLACGTMAAYGLDRLIDKRDRDPDRLRLALLVAMILAAVATAALASTAWWRVAVCAMLAVIAGAYVPLKRFVPKNVLTTVAWTTAVATLPFAGRPPLDPTFAAAVLAVACIMAANTLLCDIPDSAADRNAGVVGIAARFGPRAGAIAAVTFGGLGTMVAVWASRWGLAATAFSLAVLAVLLARNPSRALFRYLADGIVTFVPGAFALFLH